MHEGKPSGPDTAEILRLIKYLPHGNDIDLIILKGHLLVEEQLIQLVKSKVKFPAAIANVNFGFYHLLCFAKALAYQSEFDWAWEALRKLNTIRNDLAHHLEPPTLLQKLEELIQLVDDNFPLWNSLQSNDIQGKIKAILSIFHGWLSSLRSYDVH